MSEPSISTLKKGMKLFIQGNNEGKYFHLQHAVMSSPIYPPLPAAFKVAADMILDSHLAAKGPHHDILLFPVLYLYRHCIELKLKDLLLLGIRTGFFDEKTADRILDEKEGIIGEHRLCALWNKTKEFLAHHDQNDTELKVAESIINNLHQIDPDGQTLRYDHVKGTLQLRRPNYGDVKANYPVYNIPETIDIANLRQTMDSFYEYLEGNYDGILACWDAEREAIP
jgi:hypothetical protein